tara:strand:- start:70 stop:303 length:234 start_codon:yes stop_codon:yes gene_type:complete
MFTHHVRIFERVVNGSKVLWFDQEIGRFYRTLSGAKNCLKSAQFDNPKKVGKKFIPLGNGIWRQQTIAEMKADHEQP